MDITRNVLVRMSVLLCIAAVSVSCLNEYLDRSPDAGISEEEVFTQYENFRSYFNSVYNGANFNIKCHYPLWFAGNNQKMTMEGMTDMCDMARVQRCQPIKQGIGSQAEWAVGYNTESQTAKVPYSWKCIRVANMTIANIDRLLDATDREKTDLLAQAYFIRAFCHFELFRFYGSLPYIDKVLVRMMNGIFRDFPTWIILTGWLPISRLRPTFSGRPALCAGIRSPVQDILPRPTRTSRTALRLWR